MITRKEFMDGKATIDEYYAQFVSPKLLRTVEETFGDRLLESDDDCFNNIPLKEWDALACTWCGVRADLIKQAQGYANTLSDRVCTLKTAAKLIVDAKRGV